MVEQRSILLMSTDYRALPDFPNRDQLLVYRQQLRDLLANWTIDTSIPKSPEKKFDKILLMLSY
jgi:hypothetical protein